MARRTISAAADRGPDQDFVVAFVVRDLAVVAWMDSSAIPGFAQPGEAGVPQFAAGRMGRMSPIRVSWSDIVSLA